MRVESTTSGPESPADNSGLCPVLGRRQRLKYGVAIAVWAGAALYFWIWWFQPGHNLGTVRFIAITSALAWVYFLQFYFLAFFIRASQSSSEINALGEARVAMVVTKTPSEPFDVVRRTLLAMLAQDYPHDTWLADEDPTAETTAWCHAHGAHISTRKDRPDYHQPSWPRRTRCKEGNLAFFYDNFGYERYDFVSQLDADHVPQPGYLKEVLKPFTDDAVGYVSAPSICSSNASESWSARARLFSEAVFHSALQAGYSKGWAPMCIGSHYAVRTTALKAIGGLGPELAEDHSTSMLMNAGGWRGVHAINATAYGDGPATFADMLTQEFQWSRSLVTLLLQYTPSYFRALPARLKFQFVFSQSWYPLFAAFMAMTFLVPILALVFDVRFVDVTFPAFIGHTLPTTLVLIGIAYLIRSDGLFRPKDAKVLCWERLFFAFAQWPWVLWGCILALRDRIFDTTVNFRITPKGGVAAEALPFRVLFPYFVLALASIAPVFLVADVRQSAGFYLLALFNAACYSALFSVVILKHVSENKITWRSFPLPHTMQLTTAALLVALTISSGWLRGVESLHFLTVGLEPLQVTEERFIVSGAGLAQSGKMRYEIELGWQR